MRAAKHGGRILKDKELPSKALVATKFEQVEEGAPAAEDRRDVTSWEDVECGAYDAVIDPATATLRIRPGKATIKPPKHPEELRLRHRRLSLAWDFVKSRHSTRAWLVSKFFVMFQITSSAHPSLVSVQPLGKAQLGLWFLDMNLK